MLKEANTEAEAERQRKLARMQAVRETRGGQDIHPSLVCNARHLFKQEINYFTNNIMVFIIIYVTSYSCYPVSVKLHLFHLFDKNYKIVII